MARPARPVRRIAVYRGLFLGDLICAMPALSELRELFPEASVTLIGLPWASDFVAHAGGLVDHLELFPGYPGIMEVPADPARTAAFLAAARAKPYDLALQMHGSGPVSNGFVADLGAAVSAGYREGEDRRLTWSMPYLREEHEALRWVRLVRTFGPLLAGRPARSGQPRMVPLRTTPAEEARAAALLAPARGQGPLVGVHAGSKDPARRWPPERFADLADALAARHGAHIVLTGGEAERPLTAAVAAGMRAPALDLAGATDLGTLAALVGQLDLLVTNDTGAAHVAAAQGARSVALYGPSRPEQWGPLDLRRNRALDARALVPGADGGAEALRLLPAAAVLRACEEQLAAAREPAAL